MTAKRAFDFIVGGIAFLILLPFLAIVGIAVKIDSPGGALFRQQRIGQYGKPFIILKFRTMQAAQAADAPLITSGRDSRVTRVGAILRKYKIDELPQIYNVLVGEMSFVGPRPEVEKYILLYDIEKRDAILSVKPGITDKSSILFLNESELLSNSEDPESYYINNILPLKQNIYTEYVNNASFTGDIKIIIQTISSLIKFWD